LVVFVVVSINQWCVILLTAVDAYIGNDNQQILVSSGI